MFIGEWLRDGDSISGWAKGEASEPLWLELLADQEVVGITRADLEAHDGSGFWLPIPPALRMDDCEFSVRVANTNTFIASTAKKENSGSTLIGEISLDRGLTISGWVADERHFETKLSVSAIIEDVVVAKTVAAENRYRPREANGHGFSLELPARFANGESHTVRLIDQYNRELPGSPFRTCSLPQKVADWLKTQKKCDKPLQNLLADLLEMAEERLPGVISQSNFEDWKKAFPIESPSGRQRAAVNVWGNNRALLERQQGVDLKAKNDSYDYLLIPCKGAALHPYAMANLLTIMREKDAGLIYADDECEKPRFKPAWDREAFFAHDYLGPFLVRSDIAKKANINPDMELAEVRFRLAMTANESGIIIHVPQLLSTCIESGASRCAFIQDWLNEKQPGAEWTEQGIIYPLHKRPRVSILIPTRDHADLLSACLNSLDLTDWPDYEILIIDNDTKEEDALAILKKAEAKANIRVLRRPGVFNYAALNNDAVRNATGELICFLNNDTEVLQADWLEQLVRLAQQDNVGCVGAKLLWPNGLVQHGGVVVGVHQLAAHVGNHLLDDEPGYMGRNRFAQQYSAVTAACLLTSRELFLESDGFDERRFPIAFNDVDYCLRLREKGKKNYWTPMSRLAHHESVSRGRDLIPSARARSEREIRNFRLAWGHYDDPFYNPNLPLSVCGEPFDGLAFPPRPRLAR